MRRLLTFLGHFVFWAGQPVLRRYLKNSERTRIVLRHGDTVLVLKNWLGNGRWHLPGGGMHKGETPLAGAQRELLEETGIVLPAEAFEYHGRHESLPQKGIHYNYHLFTIRVDAPPKLKLQTHEISHGAWVKLDEACDEKQASPTTCYILRSLE